MGALSPADRTDRAVRPGPDRRWRVLTEAFASYALCIGGPDAVQADPYGRRADRLPVGFEHAQEFFGVRDRRLLGLGL